MKKTFFFKILLLFAFSSFLPGSRTLLYAATAASSTAMSKAQCRTLPLDPRPWKGDFKGMLKRRMIRVAIPYSRTLYYIEKGRERGVTANIAREFELFLNKKYKKQLKKRPLSIYIYPVTREKIIERLNDGTVDIAAGNLTITGSRLGDADFVQLPGADVNEIVVTGVGAPDIKSLEELSGKTVNVRSSSSYYDSLIALNKALQAKGLEQVKLTLLPDALEDEDVMEMLNVGILQIAVIDDWKARLWSQYLGKMVLHEKLVLRKGGRLGWAIRKGSNGLRSEIENFFSNSVVKNINPENEQKLLKKVKVLRNNSDQKELQKFGQIIALFEKYGEKYRFDPLLIAAQGYQESRLEQSARSHVGAIGIMQLMPATGAAMKVGNIRVTEPNIHAGAKYLDMLLENYFGDASFSEENRALFAFAAYNSGPGSISKARKDAEKVGLDPNVWFNNVEVIVAEKHGRETTRYVRNIYKYYAAYKLVNMRQKEQQKARSMIQGAALIAPSTEDKPDK